ncbi:hypothetical protein [Acinetobacter nectaris]|uniref:hypothetical protein n=1 Tax=Acinetobacter nectaris TaxID=1219382 RepID=UPI001F3D3159|nr:hypothetical protein [Acinetobacter nectaris]MCF9034195.1 hypothetical protein [Acinetobacter nectaris]
MARKVKTITLDNGRDKGKKFVITEMSAANAESWAWKVATYAMNNGMEFTDFLGMASIAQAGFSILEKLKFEQLKELLDELFACIEYLPDPKDPTVRRDAETDDLEEPSSLVRLRFSAFQLHTGFFPDAKD